MTGHNTGTRDEWLTARLALLKEEKALTRRGDELARQRRALPWVRVDKEYLSIPPTREDWTPFGACTRGSTVPPKGGPQRDATRRASGRAATTNTPATEGAKPGGGAAETEWPRNRRPPGMNQVVIGRAARPVGEAPDPHLYNAPVWTMDAPADP